ncbi:hypothetical protein [Spirulina subsalsa]|uniref:hypothetical protein n=1 Tax=Spirulina subsalsa TaxID=54311 RepID=UPI0002EE91C1|nr:hypothetical protein [Spirulina subsalsa]
MPEWLLDKIFEQVRGTTEHQETTNPPQTLQYDDEVKPIWKIALEIGEKIPDSEWAKVPNDLSKNFRVF